MASKREWAIYVDILSSRLNQMSKLDRKFVEGITHFYKERGYLTEKQTEVAKKMALKQILEVDSKFSL